METYCLSATRARIAPRTGVPHGVEMRAEVAPKIAALPISETDDDVPDAETVGDRRAGRGRICGGFGWGLGFRV